MAARIKKGDRVVVLAGRDRGKEGEVLKVLPKEDRVVVQGVMTVRRHERASAAQRRGDHLQGGADPRLERGARRSAGRQADARRLQVLDDGRKVRYAKRSGELLDR